MSLSTNVKSGPNPPRATGQATACDPYYSDMLDTIQYGSVEEAVQLFSRRGYDVNVEVEYVFDDGKKYNVTPLHWAVRYRKPKLCKYLLEHGARPFNNLVFEYYPLHEACSRGFSDILKVFIDSSSKIDLNKTTPDDDTPLHIASMRGHVECVHLLLSAGADPGICNKAGRTPVQEALYQHQDDLVQLFRIYRDPSKGEPQIRHVKCAYGYVNVGLGLTVPRVKLKIPKGHFSEKKGTCIILHGFIKRIITVTILTK